MVQSLSAQIGLLAFAAALVAGLSAGNSATVVLSRALLAMLMGVIVGQCAGWAAKLILRDHLQRKKLSIDKAHIEAIRAMDEALEGEQIEPTEAVPAEAG
jgi:aspartokinase-like uncharacterized kinase